MTGDDLSSIKAYRERVKKLWSLGIEHKKYSKSQKNESTKCLYVQTTGINRLLGMLGFTYKPEIYFLLMAERKEGDERAWKRVYVHLKGRDEETLQKLHDEIKWLAEISDFLLNPTNQQRYRFALVNALSEEQSEEIYQKNMEWQNYYIPPRRARVCTATDDSSTNMVNIINDTVRPKTIVSYRAIYQEISDFLELTLNYVDLDLTVFGYGIDIQGKAGKDTLGLTVCTKAPMDASLISTFETCAGGTVKKDSLDYNSFELSFSPKVERGFNTEMAEIKGSIGGKLKFSHQSGEGLNVTVGPEMKGYFSVKKGSHALEVFDVNLTGEIGFNFKINKGLLKVSPVAGAHAKGGMAGQTLVDMGVKVDNNNGEITYTGIADLATDTENINYWNDLVSKKKDTYDYLYTKSGQTMEKQEIGAPGYSYNGQRVKINNGKINLGLVPKPNRKIDIVVGFSLFKAGADMVKRTISDFDGTWEELGHYIAKFVDKKAMDAIANIIKIDKKWKDIWQNLFVDMAGGAKHNVDINPQTRSRIDPNPRKINQIVPKPTTKTSFDINPRSIANWSKSVSEVRHSQYYRFIDRNGVLVSTTSSYYPPYEREGFVWKLVREYRYNHSEVFEIEETAYNNIVSILKEFLELDKVTTYDHRTKP